MKLFWHWFNYQLSIINYQLKNRFPKNSTLDKFDYSELSYNFFYNEEFDPGSG